MSDQLLLGELVNRQNSINKPGTACLGCRRRKLKCLREPEGCHNCSKSGLQCVYPAPEVGVKRKRGPYKKDKTPRERHMEDLVKYLKPEALKSGHETGSSDQSSPYEAYTPGLSRSTSVPSSAQAANSESLVTDALIALTRSSFADQDARNDHAPSLMQKYVSSGVHGAAASQHPNTRKIFEYWHLFVSRVNPMVKVVHCPTFAKTLFGMIDDIGNVAQSTNALLFSIYYTALSTCTAREVRQRFGESQEELMQRYGRKFESAVSHSFDMPSLEALQALVLYMDKFEYAKTLLVQIPMQKHGRGTMKHLFELALRSAQTLRLNQDPGSSFSPLEAELRRRLWYHLCGLESRSAEESRSRNPSILHDHNVQIPANIDDRDIAPEMSQPPQSRKGITEMTFPILRFEMHRLIFGLLGIKKKWAMFEPSKVTDRTREEQTDLLELTQRRLDIDYMAHVDPSRPHDWMCIQFMGAMLIKARLVIEFPSGTVPSRTMPLRERMYLLQASVDIIQLTYLLSVDERIGDSLWYFRGFVQWDSLAVVVAELGWNTNPAFSNRAWAVLGPMLRDWDAVYESKRDDAAWGHVNEVIERARSLRRQNRPHASTKNTVSKIESTPEVDTMHDRAASAQAPSVTICPIRPATNPSADQAYAAPATLAQHYQREPLAFQQQEAMHYQQPLATQYQMTGPHEVGPYAVAAASSCGFDFGSGNGFDDIEFSAFNEVFSSASWIQSNAPENYNAQPYESMPYTASYSIPPPG